MAVAFDAVGVQGNVGASSITWTHTPVGTPTKVAVCVYTNNISPIDTVTYGGVSMTRAVQVNPGGTGHPLAEIWGLAAPLPGARTVVVTQIVGQVNQAIFGVSVTFTGSTGTTVFNHTGSNNGSTTNISGNTTSSVGDLVITAGSILHPINPMTSYGAGETVRLDCADVGGFDPYTWCTTKPGAAGTVNCSAVQPDALEWVFALASVAASDAAPTASTMVNMPLRRGVSKTRVVPH